MSVAKSILFIMVALFLGASPALAQQKPAKSKTSKKAAKPAAKTAAVKPREGFKITPTGLQYRLIEDKANTGGKGRKVQEGEIMSVHMEYDNGADSLLFSTYSANQPILVPMMPASYKGGIEEGFQLLSPGDSGVFLINSDSLFINTFRQPIPSFIKPGSFMTFRVKMVEIMTEEQAQAQQQRQFEEQQREMASMSERLAKEDEVTIQNYAKEKGLKVQRTASGLYYVITKPGSGPNAKAGQKVKVHYTGTTLDGNKFDSSLDRGQPFEFPLGQGQVIKGWDEGIALLNKGAKATLLIPSPMAYGARSPSPAIPANSILRFDVELIDMQ